MGKSSVRVEGTAGSNTTERFDHAEKEVSKNIIPSGREIGALFRKAEFRAAT